MAGVAGFEPATYGFGARTPTSHSLPHCTVPRVHSPHSGTKGTAVCYGNPSLLCKSVATP